LGKKEEIQGGGQKEGGKRNPIEGDPKGGRYLLVKQTMFLKGGRLQGKKGLS